jgi:putative transcriptional regulator
MTRRRDLFDELMEGFDALADRRAGKRTLRTHVRTLENWEQGRAKPNAQAALLIRMVHRFPDTVRRLAEI